MELPKKYKFKDIEEKWKAFWKEHNTYASNVVGPKPFSADTPPPYVSGKMHMGHALSYSQGDFIMRYRRMRGHSIFFPFGTDDNGLPTERFIEKLKNINSNKMSREDFVHICASTVKELLPSLVQPWIDLGISADFDNAYSTIDDKSIRVSQTSFLDLYHKKLAYRSDAPSAWDVEFQTSIAQAEFENIEKKSQFNDIAFHDKDGKELIIATTRPELIPACVALFAHPEDERYQYLKDKTAVVPISNHEVPIHFDEAVQKDKGTGLMMVCTFGDKEDVEKWHKYKLDLRVIINKDGTLNNKAGKYEGLKIKEARKAIVEDLRESGDLKAQKDIVHNTNVYERSGSEIEFIKTSQWFIDVLSHKEELLQAADKITWHPAHMKARYVHWVENLNWDWSISRQRHFGVPFPVWYEKDTGNVVVADYDDLPIDPITQTPKSYKGDPNNLIPEEDVMDTWATSSVSPQIALDWKGKTTDEEFANAFPMTLRMQAHDIIRTWAFYTIVKAHYNNQTIPWQNIMVSGFVLDKHGKKMSKSKGNTIDPIKIIDMYGADVVRYSASVVKLGEDIPFNDKYLETGKKLVTKIFNASKFAHMHLEDYDGSYDEDKLLPIDKWIITQCDTALAEAQEQLEAYEFSKARASVEQFFWNMCDNYLEIVKERLYKPEIHGDDARLSGQMALAHILQSTLKGLAPIVPYIAEEVWSWYFAELTKEQSIHTSQWPQGKNLQDDNYTLAGDVAVDIISACRREKTNAGKSQKHEIAKLTIQATDELRSALELVLNDIKMTVSAQDIVFGDASAHQVRDDVVVDIELAE